MKSPLFGLMVAAALFCGGLPTGRPEDPQGSDKARSVRRSSSQSGSSDRLAQRRPGHFPGATPPARGPGARTAAENILWEAKLPCYS
jgi:hypothetical protein